MGRTAKHGWPASVLRAYAQSIGKDVRTAQRHANDNNPDFLRFARGVAGENASRVPVIATTVESGGMAPPPAPVEVMMDDEALSETGRMLKASWAMWQEHYRQWSYCRGGFKDAMGQTVQADHPMMIMHAKIIMDLRKSYDVALAKHQQWQIDNRRLIPVNEFERFRAEFLLPVTSLMRNMPAEAASLMNPQNQQQAIKGGNEWLQARFMPAVDRMLEGLALMAPKMIAA